VHLIIEVNNLIPPEKVSPCFFYFLAVKIYYLDIVNINCFIVIVIGYANEAEIMSKIKIAESACCK